MGSSRAGSKQTLTIDGNPVHGPGNGFSGLSWTVDPSTFEVTGGGITTGHNSGWVSSSGSFSCVETEETLTALLGMNGLRADLVWNMGPQTYTFDGAILQVSRDFADRGARSFQVEVTVDGQPTVTASS